MENLTQILFIIWMGEIGYRKREQQFVDSGFSSEQYKTVTIRIPEGKISKQI
jgi:hypothetical protein